MVSLVLDRLDFFVELPLLPRLLEILFSLFHFFPSSFIIRQDPFVHVLNNDEHVLDKERASQTSRS